MRNSIAVKPTSIVDGGGLKPKTKPRAYTSFDILRRDSPSSIRKDSESYLKRMVYQINALEQERKMEEELRKVALDRINAKQGQKVLKAGELRIKDVSSSPSPKDTIIRAISAAIEKNILSGAKLVMRKLNYEEALEIKEKQLGPKGFLVKSSFEFDSSSAFQANRSLEDFSKVIVGARGPLSPQQDQSSSNRIGRYVLEATENNSINVRREEKTDDSLQKLKNAIRVFEEEIEKNKLERLELLKEIKKLNEEKKEVTSKTREIHPETQEYEVKLGEKESDYPSPDPAPIPPPRKLSGVNKIRGGKGSSLK
jgi:hypothetical protein